MTCYFTNLTNVTNVTTYVILPQPATMPELTARCTWHACMLLLLPSLATHKNKTKTVSAGKGVSRSRAWSRASVLFYIQRRACFKVLPFYVSFARLMLTPFESSWQGRPLEHTCILRKCMDACVRVCVCVYTCTYQCVSIVW